MLHRILRCRVALPILLLGCATLGAQPRNLDVQTQSPLLAGEMIRSIVARGNMFSMVGDVAYRAYTIDNGRIWSIRLDNTSAWDRLNGIAFTDDRHGIAVGANAVVSRTSDGGRSWDFQQLIPQGLGELYDVAFADARNGIATSFRGLYARTSDGGATWSRDSLPTRVQLVRIAFGSASVGIIVGDSGTIFRTTNGGATWADVSIPGDTVILDDVAMADSAHGIISNNFGGVYRTTDGGATWTPIFSARYPITGVGMMNRDTMFAVGWGENFLHDGMIYRSTDGGTTWDTSTYRTYDGFFNRIAVSGNGNGLIAGDVGNLFGTSDGGRTWNQLNPKPRIDLNGVSFADARHGVAVGSFGTIRYTNNAGTEWHDVVSESRATLRGVSMCDTMHGVAVGDSGTIMRTADGGVSWQRALRIDDAGAFSTVHDLYAVQMLNARLGMAVGRYNRVLRTVDGGATWSWLPTPADIYDFTTWRAVHFIDSLSGFVAGDSGTVLATVDGGHTWSKRLSDFHETNPIRSIYFFNALDGWIVGRNIQHTTDGGSTWNHNIGLGQPIYSNYFPGIDFADHDHGVLVGNAGEVFYTYDGGNFWWRLQEPRRLGYLAVSMPETEIASAVGPYEVITRLEPNPLPSAVPQALPRMHEHVVPITAVPNPSNGTALLSYTLPRAAHVRIVITNIQGQPIASIDDGNRAAGEHTARIEPVALPSGMYMVRIDAGAAAGTCTMIVVR